MNISIDDYKEWYKSLAVQYQMLPYIRNREYALFINNDDRMAVRKIKITNVQSFQFWWDFLIENQKEAKMFEHYYSMAIYDDMPMRKIHRENGKVVYDTNTGWWNNYISHMRGYDMLIDIDSKSEDLFYAHLSAMKVHAMLDKWDVPHYINCSGRGFHFIIPYDVVRSFNPSEEGNIYKAYQSIAEYLKRECSELIDADIYDSARVCRIPFSLNISDNKAFVCFPFESEEQFFGYHDGLRDLFYWKNRIIRDVKPKLFNSEGSLLKLLRYCTNDSTRRL